MRLFFKKEEARQILHRFSIDSILSDSIFTLLANITPVIMNNEGEVCLYRLTGNCPFQNDRYSCSYFALDHVFQISLIEPRAFYCKLNLSPILLNDSTSTPYRNINIYDLPLSLLRNMQSCSGIEQVRTSRPEEFYNTPVCRHPRPLDPLPEPLYSNSLNAYTTSELTNVDGRPSQIVCLERWRLVLKANILTIVKNRRTNLWKTNIYANWKKV